ncbi:hypothetical protein MMC30_005223 [Trapelia coarctata]|nr:hypothetical protein [Trapelia coarctata]
MDATSSWVESSSSVSDTIPNKGHKASKSMHRAEGDAFRSDPNVAEASISANQGKDVSKTRPKLPKIGVDDEWQNSWAQQVHESEHKNSWAKENQQGLGLGFAQARRNVAQVGPQLLTKKPYVVHQKTRSVTDPALSAPTTDSRASNLKTLGNKIFGDRLSTEKNGGQNLTTPSLDSFSAGLSAYGVLGDKASRVLGAQHLVSAEDRTLLQLPNVGVGRPEALIFSGSMSPTKTGAYGSMGKAQLQEANQFARVKSHQGLVTNIEDEHEPQKRDSAGLELLKSAVYSPSVYEGVWEKHPSVGQTIPPFNPAQGYGVNQYTQLLNARALPELTEADRNSPRPSTFHESAEVLPLFTGQEDSSVRHNNHNSFHVDKVGTNPVPAHPSSFDTTHSSTDAKLQQMEARLHHHIDKCFDRLGRMTADKIDKVLDAIMSKYEALEEQVSKGPKGMSRTDITGIKNEFDALEQGLHANTAHVTEVRRTLQAMHRTLGRVENQIVEYACKCEHGEMEDNQTDEERDPITFFDGHRHFTIDNHGNQVPAPEINQQNFGAFHRPAATGGAYQQNGQVHNADFPRIDQNGHTVVGNQVQDGVTYDLPSFMTIDNDGNAIVDIPEDEMAPQTEVGQVDTALPQMDENGNLVSAGPGQVVYDLPSFMSINNDGQMVIDLPDGEVNEEINGDDALAQVDINGNLVAGLQSPDEVASDLPSCMTVDNNESVLINLPDNEVAAGTGSVNGDGIQATAAQVNITAFAAFFRDTAQQSSQAAIPLANQAAVPQAARQGATPQVDNDGHLTWVLQGPGNVVYDLPSFMKIDENGHIVIELDDEAGHDGTSKLRP